MVSNVILINKYFTFMIKLNSTLVAKSRRMKVHVILFTLLLAFISCGEKEEKNQRAENNKSHYNENPSREDTSEYDPKASETHNKENQSPEANETTTAQVSRTYIKVDENDDDCNCYCIVIEKDNSCELCLLEDELYISTKFEEEGDVINVYYVGPGKRNTDNTDLPWDEFDTNEPIAVFTRGDDKTMKLDWKGFNINGELALDYAIYGKKTLEGDYKKTK